MHTANEPAPPPLRVVIVDPDDRIRESLVGILGIGDRVVVVGDAGDLTAAVDVVASTRPDVVLLDPRLPGADTDRRVIGHLRRSSPGVRVLVMNGSDQPRNARQDGADGVVRKTFRPEGLVVAILAAGGEARP
jgi:DNA-binding NarL/FixJ family response regulator